MRETHENINAVWGERTSHLHNVWPARVDECTLEDPGIHTGVRKLAQFSVEAFATLSPFAERYGRREATEPDKLRTTLFPAARAGSFGVLRDLHALFVMASEAQIALAIVIQAFKELREGALLSACIWRDAQNKRHRAWIMRQIEHCASHMLVVPQ